MRRVGNGVLEKLIIVSIRGNGYKRSIGEKLVWMLSMMFSM